MRHGLILDLDKKNELVVVGEWMPVTVFHQRKWKACK